jgi:hypothetical protein
MQCSITQMDNAYRWLCRQRKHFPPDADIWHFRFRYPGIKHALLWRINSSQYRFSPQLQIIKSDGEVTHLWGSQDTLVMKFMSAALGPMLALSSRCTHVNEHGGLKLEKHPDKTFIGNIEKGFNFLGYYFSPNGLKIANITWTKFVARLHRLYE